MLCFYHDDLDGRCAAAIAHRAMGKGRFIAAHYHRRVATAAVKTGETVIIVDYSMPPDAMKIMRRRAGRLIWIDHHASALASGAGDDLEGYRESGRAACELAWRFFFPDFPLPRAVCLTADRDVWTWRYGEETAAFCEGIRLEPHHPEAAVWRDLLADDRSVLCKITRDGRICRRYQRALAAEFVGKYGFEAELEGHRCYAVNFNAFGSDVFGEYYQRYPICVCFVFDGNRYNVTLYSQNMDVLPIALRFGGGGHRRAAGFGCEELPFAPITQIPVINANKKT